MASQKEILGHHLYKWFLGENADNPPKGICKDYKPQVPRRVPTYWSKLLSLLSDRLVVYQTITAVMGCLEPQIPLGPSNLQSRVENFDEIDWDALFASVIDKTNLSPLLELLVNDRIISDPDAPAAPPTKLPSHNWVEEAWGTDYTGNCHENLLKNIRQTTPLNQMPYLNTGAIVQSSGYGKSRTVDQMATLVPTIPINIRDLEDDESNAYPPPDAPVNEIFQLIGRTSGDLNNAVLKFHLFFQILFNHTAEKVKTLEKPKDSGVRTQRELATLLRADLATTGSRYKFYEAVKSEFLHRVDAIPSTIAASADESLGNLVRLLPGHDLSLIVYVDEAHTLTNVPIAPPGETLYSAMIKAAAHHVGRPFFILFLSTSSQLRHLASPAFLTRSARKSSAALVSPFTEMPFDCHPKLVKGIKPGLSLEEIQDFQFIAYFGRPLWWTFLRKDRTPVPAIKQLATAKLLYKHGPDSNKATAHLAVLDVLLSLEFNPLKTTTHQLGDEMVASHMRTAYSITEDRAFMFSGYSSEPVLVEAAMDVIQSLEDIGNTRCRDPMVDIFATIDDDMIQAIDLGQQGENVAKMILLRAYMRAVQESRLPTHIIHWHHGCNVIDFLRNLTAMHFQATVLDAVPSNQKEGKPLRDVFKNAWVRFTHFVRAGDNSAMTTSAGWGAFVRGMAMIGWKSQESVDFHIPVLLDKDMPISEGNMTGILVQVKLRPKYSPPASVAVDAEKICYFPPSKGPRARPGTAGKDSRPYISLVMELGKKIVVHHKPQKVVEVLDQGNDLSTEPPTRPSIMKGNNATTHPRYSLFFHGRTHRIYRCVPDDQPTAMEFTKLLRIGDMLDSHPEGRDHAYVEQMKPPSGWRVGNQSWSWLSDPFLSMSSGKDAQAPEKKGEEKNTELEPDETMAEDDAEFHETITVVDDMMGIDIAGEDIQMQIV
ncbi:hypothetical protein CVT25_000381 [Psilocybe cyanescens]|uniref:Uncharacterized protein n=1 Tax=Psilocybe cyanescens TaxID=93625 RepID=A0A409XEZ3_PSICY|nr:hypothetical protein CVT25_000381 [Psilocybe cyanescens]